MCTQNRPCVVLISESTGDSSPCRDQVTVSSPILLTNEVNIAKRLKAELKPNSLDYR